MASIKKMLGISLSFQLFFATSNCLAHFVNLVPNKDLCLMGKTNDVRDIRSESAAAPEVLKPKQKDQCLYFRHTALLGK